VQSVGVDNLLGSQNMNTPPVSQRAGLGLVPASLVFVASIGGSAFIVWNYCNPKENSGERVIEERQGTQESNELDQQNAEQSKNLFQLQADNSIADNQIEALLFTVIPVLAQRIISDIKPPVNVKQAYFGMISPEWPGHFLLIEQGKKLRVWTYGFFSLNYRDPSDYSLLWMPARIVAQNKQDVTFTVHWGVPGKAVPFTWEMELPEEFNGEELTVTVDTDNIDHKTASVVLRRVKEVRLSEPKK
jgi:hypothetical protein